MIRLLPPLLLLVVSLGLPGCVGPTQPPPAPEDWTAGFWFWRGSSDSISSAEPPDALFVHVGTIRRDTGPFGLRLYPDDAGDESWQAHGYLPESLPAARQYWLVFRYDKQGVPDLQVASLLAKEVMELLGTARGRRLNVAGVQLDIDSPTLALKEYARFLRAFREQLPAECELSITALLDWFRKGTDIADVIARVDEFVPQFYDVENPDSHGGDGAIAARIDPAEWGPVFNRFRKRFRLGVSVFGRARVIAGEDRSRGRYLGFGPFHRDLVPLDIATNPAFEIKAVRNDAKELVLNYRASRETRIGYSDFRPGDTVQFTLATPEAIRAAVESSRKMGGYSAGVVFFRWPAEEEGLVMFPDEVLSAAGLIPANPSTHGVYAVDGGCAAVSCADLYFENADPLAAEGVRYSIRSSVELEYFLPERRMPVRMVGSAELELWVPPYCGRGAAYLGRAVTSKASEFTAEAKK